MKKSIYIIAAAALLLAACNGKKTVGSQFGPGEYLWEPGKTVDLGTINEIDGTFEFTLLYKNETGDTLVPKMWRASCGCTVPELNNAPIPPKEYHRIPMKFNPAFKKGPQQEELDILYENGEVENLFFTVDVVPYLHPIEEDRPYHLGENLYTSHKILSYGHRKRGETADFFFRYGNGSQEEVMLRFEVKGRYAERMRLRREVLLGPDQRDTMHVKIDVPAEMKRYDTLKFVIQPYMNDVPTEGTIRATLIPD